jgi:hypothetical protein
MTIATRPVHSDALAVLRQELVGAARRQVARRHRRRRILLVAAALLALLAAAVGATALSNFSTGVPTIDKLLDTEVGDGSFGSYLGEPGSGGATEPLTVPTSDGTAQAVAYLTRDGRICHVQAEAHPRIEGAVRGGGGGCYRPADLASELDRNGVAWSSAALGAERRVFSGYANADIEGIRVLGEARGANVELTKPWRPRAPSAEALRFFVIVDERDIDVGDDGLQPDELPLIEADFPPIAVTYSDGRSVKIRPR